MSLFDRDKIPTKKGPSVIEWAFEYKFELLESYFNQFKAGRLDGATISNLLAYQMARDELEQIMTEEPVKDVTTLQ